MRGREYTRLGSHPRGNPPPCRVPRDISPGRNGRAGRPATGIVDVKLLLHGVPRRAQDVRENIAHGGPSPVANVKGPCRVGADELNLDPLPASKVGGAVVLSGSEDFPQGFEPAPANNKDVQESRAGDLGFLYQTVSRGEGGREGGTEFTGVHR